MVCKADQQLLIPSICHTHWFRAASWLEQMRSVAPAPPPPPTGRLLSHATLGCPPTCAGLPGPHAGPCHQQAPTTQVEAAHHIPRRLASQLHTALGPERLGHQVQGRRHHSPAAAPRTAAAQPQHRGAVHSLQPQGAPALQGRPPLHLPPAFFTLEAAEGLPVHLPGGGPQQQASDGERPQAHHPGSPWCQGRQPRGQPRLLQPLVSVATLHELGDPPREPADPQASTHLASCPCSSSSSGSSAGRRCGTSSRASRSWLTACIGHWCGKHAEIK